MSYFKKSFTQHFKYRMILLLKMWILFLSFFTSLAFAYIGPKANEATLSFRHWVELSPDASTNLIDAQKAITEQLRYMVGPLAHLENPAAPRGDHKISHIQLETLSDGRVIAYYSYQGTVLVSTTARALKFALPRQPDQIYQTSLNGLQFTELNPCTDETFPDKKFFHYYWSPSRKGCSEILKIGKDYFMVHGHLQRHPNAENAFPVYEQLTDSKGEILIYLLIGKAEANRYRNPMLVMNSDTNAKNFRKMASELKSYGFSFRKWSLNEVKTIVKEPEEPYPYVLELEQNYNGNRAKKVIVRMVYMNATLNDKEPGLLYFLEEAMRNSAVVIWDGHSGVGLDCLPGVTSATSKGFDFSLNQNRYQIFSFNTCSSYSYYNAHLLQQKADSLFRLDIISAGLETPFANGTRANMTLIKAIHNWAEHGYRTGYKTLTKRMENQNLVGVNWSENSPASCDYHLQ